MFLKSCWKSRQKSSYGLLPFWFRPGFAALLWLCLTQFGCSTVAVWETKTVVQKDAEFAVTYNDTVTSDNLIIYAFNHTVSRNKVSSAHSCPIQTCVGMCLCGSLCVCVCLSAKVLRLSNRFFLLMFCKLCVEW